MPSLSTTTFPELRALFTARIVSTVPRIVYKGSEGWKPYRREESAATRTRRFRLVFEPGNYVTGGYFTPTAVETSMVLRVRTSYTGDHEHHMDLVQDDWHQLGDRLGDLTPDPANGLTLVLTTPEPPRPPANTDHARRQLAQSSGGTDTIQMDLTYNIRYFKARASAA